MEGWSRGFGKNFKMIKVNNISKKFNLENDVLNDVSFHVKRGEIFLLKGQSGSGKSTLLGIICGIYKPDSGEVVIDNTSINKLPEHFTSTFRRQHIGLVFQDYQLISRLSVIDNILLPTLVNKKDLRKKARELLEKFDMQDKKDEIVKNISGGEAQRVAIMRALINSAKVILFDEPTANLDTKLSLKLLEHLKDLKSLGHTLLISSHDSLLCDWNEIDGFYELKK